MYLKGIKSAGQPAEHLLQPPGVRWDRAFIYLCITSVVIPSDPTFPSWQPTLQESGAVLALSVSSTPAWHHWHLHLAIHCVIAMRFTCAAALI